VLAWLAGCGGGGSSEDLASALRREPALSTFVAVVQASGLEPALAQAQGVTVFAPTDSAFEAWWTQAGTSRAELLADPARAAAFVRGHLVDRALGRAELPTAWLRHVVEPPFAVLRVVRHVRGVRGGDYPITAAWNLTTVYGGNTVTAGVELPPGLADETIVIPECHEAVLPIVASIPVQLLSYYIAVERGCDVDKPRNLAKSVTVE
jgi:hypothetical protein